MYIKVEVSWSLSLDICKFIYIIYSHAAWGEINHSCDFLTAAIFRTEIDMDFCSFSLDGGAGAGIKKRDLWKYTECPQKYTRVLMSCILKRKEIQKIHHQLKWSIYFFFFLISLVNS